MLESSRREVFRRPANTTHLTGIDWDKAVSDLVNIIMLCASVSILYLIALKLALFRKRALVSCAIGRDHAPQKGLYPSSTAKKIRFVFLDLRKYRACTAVRLNFGYAQCWQCDYSETLAGIADKKHSNTGGYLQYIGCTVAKYCNTRRGF